MRKPYIIIVLLAVSVVTGCATQAQKQYTQMVQTYGEEVAKFNQCSDDVERNNSSLKKTLDELLIVGSNDPMSVQKMSIERYMTEDEKNDLLNMRAKKVPCKAALVEGVSKVHPDLVTFYTKWYAIYDKEALALIKDDKTIGESNESRLDWVVEAYAEHQTISTEITQQLNQSHYAEMENRQRATASLQQWSYQQQLLQQNQQMINSVNRPITTNCRYVGYNLRCQSY